DARKWPAGLRAGALPRLFAPAGPAEPAPAAARPAERLGRGPGDDPQGPPEARAVPRADGGGVPGLAAPHPGEPHRRPGPGPGARPAADAGAVLRLAGGLGGGRGSLALRARRTRGATAPAGGGPDAALGGRASGGGDAIPASAPLSAAGDRRGAEPEDRQ